jgi:hypothetical protein
VGGCSSSRPVVQPVGSSNPLISGGLGRLIGPKVRALHPDSLQAERQFRTGYPRGLLNALVNFTSPSPPTASANTASK